MKPKFQDSPIWKALLKVREHYFEGRSISLKSGNLTRVWKDPIKGDVPFCDKFPLLFGICNFPDMVVSDWQHDLPGLFRRRLFQPLCAQWAEMCGIMNSLVLQDGPDVVGWTLGPKNKFTTKYVYNMLEKPISGCNYSWIWKAKIPLKIKNFLWQLAQDAVLTRDVMNRRNWKGNPRCSFCYDRETSSHLFFGCPVAKVVWRTVASMLGTDLCPTNSWQYFAWCYAFLPDGFGSDLLVYLVL